MRCVPLTAETARDWDSVSGGWFWHTRAWLEYVAAREDSESRHFLIYDKGPVAICPLTIEEFDGIRRFSYQHDFIPAPVVRTKQAYAVYAAELERIAREENVGYARLLGGQYLLRNGFTQVQAYTQMIDLTRDDLLKDMRKGARQHINPAGTQIIVHGMETTEAKLEEYRAMHAIEAGRQTRPRKTFDLMLGWIKSGKALLIEVRKDAPVAFVIVIAHGEGAYYASSCSLVPNVTQAALWAAMQHLKERGFKWFDLGRQFFGSEWIDPCSKKDVSISQFKRSLGGQTQSVPEFERFYNPYAAASIIEKRVERLLDHIQPELRAAA